MQKKTVTLSANTADLLMKRHALQAEYEKLVKEVHGFDVPHLDDNDLIRNALADDIYQMKQDIENLMYIKQLREVNHDT